MFVEFSYVPLNNLKYFEYRKPVFFLISNIYFAAQFVASSTVLPPGGRTSPSPNYVPVR